MNINLDFENSFSQLPSEFYSKIQPERITKNPSLIHLNQLGCQLIDLASSTNPQLISQYFSGNKSFKNSDSLAMVYSGHQFGVWAGQLGDGRAILLGQVKNTKQEVWDIQIKGSGLTPYSRMGDGRAVLRSSIREYLGAEMMYGLKIASTRSLCLLSTQEKVIREQIEPGAILTRLSPSHIRFGHFEHFYYQQDWHNLKILCDYVIKQHHPQWSNQYDLWLNDIVDKTAKMIAQWMAYGFCHGVMNTDNMSILGLTIDYGPFGFLEKFQPNHICNHSDATGRYAYNQQPAIAYWNLQALAHALQPIISQQQSGEIIQQFTDYFQNYYQQLMRAKIGISHQCEKANELWRGLLELIKTEETDYTLTFYHLLNVYKQTNKNLWLSLFKKNNTSQEKASKWLNTWVNYQTFKTTDNPLKIEQILKQHNAKFILRNWIAQAVIEAIQNDTEDPLLEQILLCCQNPFEQPSIPDDIWQTYCQPSPKKYENLLVSCSS